MNNNLPRVLTAAISKGIWQDPGPNVINKVLGVNLDLPELKLFESYELMSNVHAQIRSGGYVEDPEFCMIEKTSLEANDIDSRLNFERALFVAGSIVPGDDVFVVLDLDSDENNPNVLVFDWRKSIPERWVKVMTLMQLINKLEEGTEIGGTPNGQLSGHPLK
jgi:hypothetical protein